MKTQAYIAISHNGDALLISWLSRPAFIMPALEEESVSQENFPLDPGVYIMECVKVPCKEFKGLLESKWRNAVPVFGIRKVEGTD